MVKIKVSHNVNIGFPVLIPWSLFSCPHNKVAHCSLCEEHLLLDLVPIDVVLLQKVLPVIDAQTERVVLCSFCYQFIFGRIWALLTSSTPSSPMRPSGDAPNTPPLSNQRPVPTGWIPDIRVKLWMARDSLSTPQATALTLLMLYSPRGRFMREWLALLWEPPQSCWLSASLSLFGAKLDYFFAQLSFDSPV